jgi:hypothetical protein
MTRKKCKRKVWSTSINAVAHAVAGACVADNASLDKLRLCELSAIDAMIKGVGTPEDFRWLCDVLNIAECMAKDGIGIELIEICEKAQKELLDAKDRYDKHGKLGLSGEGIKVLRELIEMHDLQRTSIARSEYEKMIRKTANYIKSHGKDVVEIT